MSFEISANPIAMSIYNNIAVQQSNASSALAKVATGTRAGEAAAVATDGSAARLQSTLAATQTAITSTQNAVNALRVADGAYGDALGLARSGLSLAQEGVAVGADTAAVDAQLDAVQSSIASLNANTQYNGVAVLGTPVTASVNAAGSTITVTPSAIAAIASSGDRVADYSAAIDAIAGSRAENSGNLSALQNSLQVLEATIANQQAAVGRALSADMVQEMMGFTSANIMTEAGMAMHAQAANMPSSVLRLL